MKLIKEIAEWSLVGIPTLTFCVLVVLFKGTATPMSAVIMLWLNISLVGLILCIGTLALLKIKGRMEARHEGQAH